MMRLSVATVTVAVLLAPMASRAEEQAPWISGSLGAGAGLVQKYEGADDTRTVPILILEVELPTRFGTFALGEQGLSWTPIDGEQFRAGIFATYDTGRVDNDHDDDEFRSGSSFLRGMGEIEETVEAGGYVGWNFGGVETALSARRAVGSDGHDGTVAELSAQMPVFTQSAFTLAAGTSLRWADSNYNQAYFGVTPAQSARSGFARHEAGSGINAAEVNFVGTYSLTPQWTVVGVAGYRRLLGDVKDSPIVRKEGYPQFALMLTWSWGKSR